jgi:hypothetical protein
MQRKLVEEVAVGVTVVAILLHLSPFSCNKINNYFIFLEVRRKIIVFLICD